jgi:ArsR family transcriptional regulator
MDRVKNRDFTDEAEILKVLGHPLRLKIVCGLVAGECCVSDIWNCLDVPQATVSQHLALLRHKGIIKGTRKGSSVRYSVVHPIAKKITQVMGGTDLARK